MLVQIDSFIPLVTIIAAASAPVISSIWAEGRRAKDAKRAAELAAIAAMKVAEVKNSLQSNAATSNEKMDQIHTLVNNQLTQAVERFEVATARIVDLETQVKKLRATPPKRAPRPRAT